MKFLHNVNYACVPYFKRSNNSKEQCIYFKHNIRASTSCRCILLQSYYVMFTSISMPKITKEIFKGQVTHMPILMYFF